MADLSHACKLCLYPLCRTEERNRGIYFIITTIVYQHASHPATLGVVTTRVTTISGALITMTGNNRMMDSLWLREWLGIGEQPASFPSLPVVNKLFQLLKHKARLIPPVHWMLLGEDLCQGALGLNARPPTAADLEQLQKILKNQDEDLVLLGEWLITQHQQQLPALVFQQRASLQMDQLLRVNPEQWSHPVQVLDRPIASLWSLIQECRLRLLAAPDEEQYRARLRRVLMNLERLVRLEENAEIRRKYGWSMSKGLTWDPLEGE